MRSAFHDRRRCVRTHPATPCHADGMEPTRTASNNHRRASPSSPHATRIAPADHRSLALYRAYPTSRPLSLSRSPGWSRFVANEILVRFAARYDGKPVTIDEHFRGFRPRVVVRCHHEAVRAGGLNCKQVTRLRVVNLSVEREEVSAFADWTDDVGNGGPLARIHRFDSVKGVVMRWPKEISHAG